MRILGLILFVLVATIWENIMKFILVCLVIAALFWHTEIGNFINGSSAPVQTAPAKPALQAGAPHTNGPTVLAMPPDPRKTEAASAPVVIGKEEDGWLTKWFIEHTPKK